LSEVEKLIVSIGWEQSGKRLDAVLTASTPFSRSRIQQLLRQGHIVRAAGMTSKTAPVPPFDAEHLQASMKVLEGDCFSITIPETQALSLDSENIPLDILFEDEHLIIVNKPAGMVVHPSHGHGHGTLVHALLHHCPNLPGINGIERPGIVHRLDKDTSGSLVVAKTEAAHIRLSEMFADHDLTRQYVAWCRGAPRWKHRRIELPLGRHPQHRQKMAVHHNGKEAITDVEVELFLGPFSQLRLTLHTGRTHQIRVHLSHERLPILGDQVYARNYHPGLDIPEPSRTAIESLQRQALHAELLAFSHPITGDAIRVTAPLPDDLIRLSDALRQNFG